MDLPVVALIASFIAMAFVVSSYFVKKKELFILCQSLTITFLAVSYFFSLEFFAMVGLAIGLVRAVVCFVYEKQNKPLTVWFPVMIVVATVTAYFVVDLWILGHAKPLDILCLVASSFYAFIFRVRDLKTVRFLMLIPTSLSIAFNLLVHAPLGASLSYVFELTANVLALLRYYVFTNNKKEKQPEKENSYENN